MSEAAPLWPDLIPQLQPWISEVRGQLVPNQILAEMTTLRVGGPAQLFFRPADEEDLSFFLKNLPQEIKVTVIGLGSIPSTVHPWFSIQPFAPSQTRECTAG